MLPFADIIGYFALFLNLYSMSVEGEQRLRIISLAANAIYIVYGYLISATPVILGCTVAVLLHAYRLIQIRKKNYERDTSGRER